MMNFTIMQILRQTFGGLYSFVASIASIKAGIFFILFISVFMVLVPIKATSTKIDTKKDIHNIESEDDIKYAAQSPTDRDTLIMKQKNRIIQIGVFFVCLIVFSCLIDWDFFDGNDQQNHNQNNIHRNMNDNPFRFHED